MKTQSNNSSKRRGEVHVGALAALIGLLASAGYWASSDFDLGAYFGACADLLTGFLDALCDKDNWHRICGVRRW